LFKFFKGRQDQTPVLRQMTASLNSLAVNLILYSDMRGVDKDSEEERGLRLDMSLSDLKDFRSLMDGVDGDLSPAELRRSLDLMRSFAVISELEGTDFLVTNLERILRSARWAIANIEKVSRV